MGGQGWGPLGLGARGLKAGGFIRRTHLLPALQQGAFAGSLPLLLLAERFTTDHSQPKPQVASVSRPQLGVGLTSCLTGSPVPFTLVTGYSGPTCTPSPKPEQRNAHSLGPGCSESGGGRRAVASLVAHPLHRGLGATATCLLPPLRYCSPHPLPLVILYGPWGFRCLWSVMNLSPSSKTGRDPAKAHCRGQGQVIVTLIVPVLEMGKLSSIGDISARAWPWSPSTVL